MYGLGSLWGVCTHTAGALFQATHHFPPRNGNGSIRGESKPVREPDPRTRCLCLYSHSFTDFFFFFFFFELVPLHLHANKKRSGIFFLLIFSLSSAHVVVHRELSDYTGGSPCVSSESQSGQLSSVCWTQTILSSLPACQGAAGWHSPLQVPTTQHSARAVREVPSCPCLWEHGAE